MTEEERTGRERKGRGVGRIGKRRGYPSLEGKIAL